MDFAPERRGASLIAPIARDPYEKCGLGAHWVMAAPLRYLSYAIDTILLTAALLLATMLHQYPFVHGWLTAKVLLLVCYVALGSVALKRGGTAAVRRCCWLLALCVYAFIISIARAHHPLGIFS